MALRRTISKRLLSATATQCPSPVRATVHSPPPWSASRRSHRGPFTSPVSTSPGFFRQLRGLNNNALPSSIFSLPVGDKLREKLQSMNLPGHQLPRFDELSKAPPAEDGGLRVSAADAKRVMRLVQLEQVRARLRKTPASTVPYSEFVGICADVCGSRETGADVATALDQSGNVIVLGGVVFLRPDQVAKSMEAIISESIAMPNDPRRAELENLEQEKSLIDKKARSQVQGELYCGLGFVIAQTLGLMRLTFWELTWDVMEPICFFATSLHFALAYAFFLRTSVEPSFEGYFRRRFRVKQNNLIRARNFDINRYNQLRHTLYPNKHGRETETETETAMHV